MHARRPPRPLRMLAPRAPQLRRVPHLALLAMLALGAGACTGEDRRAPPSPPPPASSPAPLASATAADLARELDDAERLGSWLEVRRRWQGQVLRWRVTRQRALCRTADACNVAVFPIQRPAPAGWLPTLRFAPGQFEALEARCAGRDLCEVTIEGRVDKLTASGELPTSLELGAVRVVTDARPDAGQGARRPG